MKHRRATALAAAGTMLLALIGGAVVADSASATASTIPTYYPDAGSIGTVTFYNGSGAQITSGSVNDAPLAAYYKASGPKTGSFANNKGFIVYLTPQDGVDPRQWTTAEQWTASQNYTTLQASYPAGLNDPSTHVVISGASSVGAMALHIANAPSTSVANPAIYQVRLFTSVSADTYYTADIKVTGTSWTQVYPEVTGTPTTTALQADKTSPQSVGTGITLTATVAPAAAGAVEFFDGATDLGAADSYSAGTGIATKALTPAAGSHNYTAQFTPTDSNAFGGSTSTPALAFTITAPAENTATTLGATPSSPVTTSTPVVLTATVTDTPTPATIPSGTVTFKDGATTLQSGIVVDGSGHAVATVPQSTLSIGSHSFTAEFVPAAGFNGSTSSAVTFSITLPNPTVVVSAASSAARVGVAATCNPGSWTYAGGFTYAWFLDAAVVPFATTQVTGPLPASYFGHKITCVATAFNPSGSTASTSAAVTVAAGSASVNKTHPKILGTHLVGRTLTAYRGVWAPTPTTYQYIWKRGSVIVSRVAAYRTTAKDKGKSLVLYVYAVRTGYLTGIAASLPVRIG